MARAFGKYRLSQRIGVGATAEVFEATREDGAQVVLKRILPQRAGHPRFRELFEREARIVRDLSHPNIVRLLDFGEIDRAYFLALEKIDGGDLAKLIDAGGSPGVPLAILIAREVAKALAYVHAQRGPDGPLVHRDVSPENVLVSIHGEVKLADFGIAQATEAEGKEPYVAPEGSSGPPADVYALAAVLKEMIGADRMRGTGAGGPVPISGMDRALSADPKERPTAAEMIRQLEERLPRMPTAAELGRWVARAIEAERSDDVDALAQQLLLGEANLRPNTAIFAQPQDVLSVETQVVAIEPPPAKQPIKVSLPVFFGALALTAVATVIATRATMPEREVQVVTIAEPVLLEPPPSPPPPPTATATPAEPMEIAEADPPRRIVRRRPTGMLSVSSNPRALVYVDGELVGGTPLEATVTAGSHHVVLRAKSGKILHQFITDVRAGDRRVHDFYDGQ